MDSLPLWIQIICLIILILCSAFFSGSETSMMSLNKHRLKHLAQDGNKGAKRAMNLLSRPDRLLGTILLGNNFINIFAASLATIIGMQLWGNVGILIMTVGLTIVLLIFGEVAPKTYAAFNAEKFAFPASRILKILLKLLYPAVILVNAISAVILRLFGIKDLTINDEYVSKEELKSILNTVSDDVHEDNQEMMLGLLHLEEINVEDLMVAKHEIVGVDMEAPWADSIKQILNSKHERLIVYRENIDNIIGILQLHNLVALYRDNLDLCETNLLTILDKPYFIPEGTTLRRQLGLFQTRKLRTAMIVDEYGNIIGLLTLEDIIEYIVGDLGLKEIAEDENIEEIIKEADDLYKIEGTLSIKYINRELNWDLPTEGPKTISGLIMEELGQFPKVGTTVTVDNYKMTVLSFSDNRVNQVQIKVLDFSDDES